ncbi:MAG: hypothetical protein AAF411_01440 [Myxococcota bacterium]
MTLRLDLCFLYGSLLLPAACAEPSADERRSEAAAFAPSVAMASRVDAGPIEQGMSAFTLDLGGPEEVPYLPPRYGMALRARVANVQLFQSLVVEGETPLMASRGARIRVRVQDALGASLLGRVRWSADGELHTVATAFPRAAADAFDMNFDVPAEWVSGAVDFEVELLEDEGRPRTVGDDVARELRALGARSQTLHVRLLPFRYRADGSNRLPALDVEDVDALRRHLEAVFPISRADVQVGEVIEYDDPVSPLSFDEHVAALEEVMARRALSLDERVFYVGLVAPEAEFRTYCANGCFAGVAPLNVSNVAFQRSAMSIWYADESSRWTVLHEIGHALGRAHAPCGGVPSSDPDFPHQEGAIGVEGYDVRTGTYVAATRADFMSYCRDEWISDYTYQGIAERLAQVDAAAWRARTSIPQAPRAHHVFTVADGVEHVRTMDLRPGGAVEVRAHYADERSETVWGRRITYAEGDAISLAVPIGAERYEALGRVFEAPREP